MLGVNDNNRFNINANDNINNNRPARGMARPLLQGSFFVQEQTIMKTYRNLYKGLCSFENLERAYWQAGKHKSNNPKVLEFEKHWRLNLCILLRELRTKTYKPLPLKKFVLRDPKTRLICVSDFRDRIVHHALVNILQPIFEPKFIHDSYASRKGKGTLAALERFDQFKRKVTMNGKTRADEKNRDDVIGYVLKADIRQYFQSVDHDILLSIIARHVKDEDVLWLTKTILDNYESEKRKKGMPLGNWTSQFFANIYLNELDQYIKHKLKAKYYIRYVDDFVILHQSRELLQQHCRKIKEFVNQLHLELHPDKCKIIQLSHGVGFLGFKVFYHHKLVRRRNLRKVRNRLKEAIIDYQKGSLDASDVIDVLHGWKAYAMHGNTYRLRERLHAEISVELIAARRT